MLLNFAFSVPRDEDFGRKFMNVSNKIFRDNLLKDLNIT